MSESCAEKLRREKRYSCKFGCSEEKISGFLGKVLKERGTHFVKSATSIFLLTTGVPPHQSQSRDLVNLHYYFVISSLKSQQKAGNSQRGRAHRPLLWFQNPPCLLRRRLQAFCCTAPCCHCGSRHLENHLQNFTNMAFIVSTKEHFRGVL